VPDKRKQSVMLIDGYGLIFRAYHAIDSAMSSSSGEQTNAVFGFTRMLLDVLESQRLLLTTGLEYATARASISRAYADLETAAGVQ